MLKIKKEKVTVKKIIKPKANIGAKIKKPVLKAKWAKLKPMVKPLKPKLTVKKAKEK